jgi:hypothetical protein
MTIREALVVAGLAMVAGGCGRSGPSFCAGVTCAALDQCHEDGTCDPASGSCSRPLKPEGTPCNDGSALTFYDACRAGVCIGVPAAVPVITSSTPASPNDTSATPTFSGTAQVTPAGVTSRAQLYQDDECHHPVADGAAVVADGRFSVVLPATAAVAINTASAFTVRVTDSLSNASLCSAPFTYVYARPGATPVSVGVSQVMKIRIPDGPIGRGTEDRAAGGGVEKAAGGQRQRTVEARVVEVRVPRAADRARADPVNLPPAPAPAPPEVREPERVRPAAPSPGDTAASGPAVEEAPTYVTEGFRKPTTTEPGCVPRTVRITSEMLDRVSGPVVVKFAVGRDGVPGRFEVMTALADQRLGNAIWQAVQGCKWTAGADAQGRPTNSWVIMPLRFATE